MANCAHITLSLGESTTVREVGLPAAADHSFGKGEVRDSFLPAGQLAREH
jgi:hypothetical protein